MENNFFALMKSERACQIRTRLVALREKTWQAYHQAQDDERAAWFIGNEIPEFSEIEEQVNKAQEHVKRLWNQIEALSFRLSLVTEPTCKFCGTTWGLSQEVDLRHGIKTLKEAARAGCFWCCGWCYAHVLNAAYSNRPEMRPK